MSESDKNCQVETAGASFSPKLLCNAINIYLEIAYPKGNLPQPVKSILEKLKSWEGESLDCAPFVREGLDGESRYYLRLGNCNYPHMKMFIETWPGGAQYLFRADTHDRHIMVPSDHPEFKLVSDLCRSNLEIAGAIEEAWQGAGLPTFKRCLAEAANRVSDGCR